MINTQFKLCWLFQRDEALKRTIGLYKKEKINVSIAISSLSLLVDGAKTVHFRTQKKFTRITSLGMDGEWQIEMNIS